MGQQDVERQYRHEDGKIDVLKLYDTYYDAIFRYVLNRTGDVEVSRDIAADVFFKVHRHRRKYVFTGAPVTAWLYRIAGNEVITWQRKRKYRPVELENAMQQNGIFPVALRGDLQEEIQEAQAKVDQNAAFHRVLTHMKRLPAKYQEVIVLRFLEEKSIREISILLGKKEGTVKSLVSRGLTQLRKMTRNRNERLSRTGLLVETSPNEGVN